MSKKQVKKRIVNPARFWGKSYVDVYKKQLEKEIKDEITPMKPKQKKIKSITAWAIVNFDHKYYTEFDSQMMIYMTKISAEERNLSMDEEIIKVKITIV